MDRRTLFRRNIFSAFVVLGLLFAAVVGATVKLYAVSAEDYPSEVESMDISKQRALEKAVKKAKKEAGVYLQSYSRSINGQLTDDDIIAITSNSYKIVGEPKYTRELINHSGDTQIIVWKVNVEVQVDDSEIQSWLKRDDNEKLQIITQTRDANEASDENERKIEDLREKYNRATSQAERDSIIKQMNAADRDFLAQQKFEMASRFYFNGNYNGAIKLYNEALELNSNDCLAYGLRGNAYLGLKQYEQAVKDSSKAIQINPNYASAYRIRGTAYIGLKQYERAILDCDKSIQLNPNEAWNYCVRGVAHYMSKEYDKAIKDYNKSIELNRNFVEAYFACGCLYNELEQYEMSIQNFSMAYKHRGIAYSKIGQYERGINDFDKVINVNPDDEEAYLNRGAAYALLGNLNQAINDASKAIQLDKNYSKAYMLRGLCYIRLGYEVEGLADFAKAKELGYNG